jgi:putative N6-adenine-specific DNA methylase
MKQYLTACTCTFGMESVLKREIIKLGYEIASSSDGAVSVNGDITDIYKLLMLARQTAF